ncbi:hypothetical protein [Caballeronia sp. KNU42]
MSTALHSDYESFIASKQLADVPTTPKRARISAGDVFGRLTVIARAESSKKYDYRWSCRCECGGEIVVAACNLRTGNTSSCGCLRLERLRAATSTHGESGSRAYGIWSGMHSRCSNPGSDDFENYGGRGISVCERWNSFENFLADMGRPAYGMTIERDEVNGMYEPNNCHWAGRKEQNRNKRTNQLLTYRGETMCLVEWAERIGVAYWTCHARLRRGWTAQQIIETPVGGNR